MFFELLLAQTEEARSAVQTTGTDPEDPDEDTGEGTGENGSDDQRN